MYLDKVTLQPVDVGCQVHSPACSTHFTLCREREDCCQYLHRLAQLQLQYSLLAGQCLVGGKFGGMVSQLCQQMFPLLHLLLTVSRETKSKLLHLFQGLQESDSSCWVHRRHQRRLGEKGEGGGRGKGRCPGGVGLGVGVEVGVEVRGRVWGRGRGEGGFRVRVRGRGRGRGGGGGRCRGRGRGKQICTSRRKDVVISGFNALNGNAYYTSCTQCLMVCGQQLHGHRGRSTYANCHHMTAVEFSQ